MNFIRKLFSASEPAPEETVVPAPDNREVPTIPMMPVPESSPTAPVIETPVQLEVPQYVVGAGQSIGMQREHNEDSLFTLTTILATNGISLPLGLYIVADGMGGHKQGEIASGLAVRTISSNVIRKIFMALLAANPSPPEESLQDILESSLLEAHRTVARDAPGSGTTTTAILIVDRRMSIAHIGDSRAYSITPSGEMNLLTRDHSLVMRMIELGQLTEQEAAVHPQRNVLYRALGQGEPFAADISSSPLPESGYILICSDGLWGVVEQKHILQIIATSPDPQAACQRLIDAANEAGGPDNITAILVKLPELKANGS
jgi:PPM family protein phosphatase